MTAQPPRELGGAPTCLAGGIDHDMDPIGWYCLACGIAAGALATALGDTPPDPEDIARRPGYVPEWARGVSGGRV